MIEKEKEEENALHAVADQLLDLSLLSLSAEPHQSASVPTPSDGTVMDHLADALWTGAVVTERAEMAIGRRVEVLRQNVRCYARIKDRIGDAFYFVHYEGWGPEWDEWVDHALVFPNGTTKSTLVKVGKRGKETGKLWQAYTGLSLFLSFSFMSCHSHNSTKFKK